MRRAALLLACLCLGLLWSGEPSWADRHGSDSTGDWAELDIGGSVVRLRWRVFAGGERAWLAESPVSATAIRSLVPAIPEPMSLRWRQAQDIAEPLALLAAIEAGRPGMRCLLPRHAWLAEVHPKLPPGWPRLWTGDRLSTRLAYQPIPGTRYDEVAAMRLFGQPWSDAELIEPPFPPAEEEGMGEADRYLMPFGSEEPPAWLRPVDRIGRANLDGVPLAAVLRVRKDGEAHAGGEPEGAGIGVLFAVLDLAGPGAVSDPRPPADGPVALVAPGHAESDAISVSASPDGLRALTQNRDGIRLWDLARGLAIGALRDERDWPLLDNLVTWSADGSRVFTASVDGTVACWAAADARLVWRAQIEIDDGSWVGHSLGLDSASTHLTSMCIAGDGRFVRAGHAEGNEDRSWNEWFDAETGTILPDPSGWTVSYVQEEQDADGQATGSYRITSEAGSPAPQAGFAAQPIVHAAAGLLAACDGAVLRRWRLPGLSELPVVALRNHQKPRSDGCLLPLDETGDRWLFHDARELASVIGVTDGAQRSAAADGNPVIRRADGTWVASGLSASALAELVPGARIVRVGELPPVRAPGLSLRGGYGQLEFRDGESVIASITVRGSGMLGIAWRDERRLLIGDRERGWSVDLADLVITPADAVEAAPETVSCPGTDGAVWRVVADGGWHLVDPAGAVRGGLAPDPLRRAGGRALTACATAAGTFAVSDGRTIVARSADGALRWWVEAGEPAESPVRALAVSPDGRVVASLGASVALRRASDGGLLCRFVLGPAGPVPVTPDGRYAVRGDPGSAIAFRHAGEVWPVTEFDLSRNRPDVVLSAIGLADGRVIAAMRAAWESRCRRLGVRPALAESPAAVPTARIVREALPLATPASEIELAIDVGLAPPGSTLVVRMDEVPVPSRLGTPITGSQERRTLALVPGINRISVSVRLPDGREGLRDSAWVASRAKLPPARLHLLAVGCSRYRKPGLDLDYAAKDARDLASALAPATTALVTDAAATREGIAGAAERLRSAAPHDTVVLFLAGHGVLDPAGDYWFLTHDADPHQPAERGLAYGAVESLLETCPARRRLILLDTCHAGELDAEGLVAVSTPPGSAPGVKARGLRSWRAGAVRPGFEFLDLRSGIGAAVLASSAGLEFALESADWSNGVFTLAVLEGWARGGADGDADGTIKVSELAAFVAGRVQALTGGTQNPALRSANRSSDAVLPRAMATGR